jgi:undecaprenyl-diphosphatase
VLLGIVQGIFMFFPVSSTGHLVLTQHLLSALGSPLPPPESPEMILFDLVAHVGTVVSIVIVFGPGLLSLGRGFADDLRGALARGTSYDGGGLGTPAHREGLHLRLAWLGMVSVAVTGVFGFVIREVGTGVFAHTVAVAITLTVTGAILWWTDTAGPRWRGVEDITVWVAVGIGAAQGLALLPGLSRSGLTIAFALLVGLQRDRSAQYSFYLAIPTILAAAVVQAFDVLRDAAPIQIGLGAYAVGSLVAAVVGVVALKLVLAALYRARFRYFAYYVWALALVILFVEVPGF